MRGTPTTMIGGQNHQRMAAQCGAVGDSIEDATE
jgi:hypothetical protein